MGRFYLLYRKKLKKYQSADWVKTRPSFPAWPEWGLVYCKFCTFYCRANCKQWQAEEIVSRVVSWKRTFVFFAWSRIRVFTVLSQWVCCKGCCIWIMSNRNNKLSNPQRKNTGGGRAVHGITATNCFQWSASVQRSSDSWLSVA